MTSIFRCGSKCWAAEALLIFALALFAPSFGQNREDGPLDRARSFFAKHDTLSALTEYERFLFFSSDERQNQKVCEEAAEKLFASGAFASAAAWYKRAADLAADSGKAEDGLMSCLALVRSHNVSEASFELESIDTTTASESFKRKYLLCRGFLSLHTYRWDEAMQCLRRYESSSASGAALFDQWLRANPPPRGKNKTVAQVLSLLLPGSGQAYAGAYGSALNALALNAVTGYPAFTAVEAREWIDASLYLWLFTRFYFGGWSVAGEKIDDANERFNRRYAERCIAKVSH